ncbi:hypothetical protein GGR96_003040 [Thalassospira tepidiphila]|uniref:Peptidylprolyl isomerase n=1 Tax=Thalassospira tepidiphila TaxID=393657 RepID=A0ABX0X2P2_9PROT|nr:hypothetical protein [Thalassospira tepidiphila]
MKAALIVIALLLLGSGGMVLVSEGRALSQLENKRAAFANGDGFGAERDAMVVDSTELDELLKYRLIERPFDPVLLGLKAGIVVKDDLALSAKLFDQAQVIAPRDPRVQALRDGLQMRLQSLTSPASQLAE